MKEIFKYENDRNHLTSTTKGGSPIEENGDEGDDREIWNDADLPQHDYGGRQEIYSSQPLYRQ